LRACTPKQELNHVEKKVFINRFLLILMLSVNWVYCLKRSLAVIGIILLLLGIIMMSYSNITTQRLKPEIVGEASPQNPPVSVSANFSAGELYSVYISPGEGWNQPPLEPVSGEVLYPSRFVWVNITNPQGNTTVFEFAFGIVDSSMALYMISVLSSNFSRERTAPSPSSFVLKADIDGTYTATLWQIIPYTTNPFGAFQLRKIHIEFEKSFSYLLYIGACLLVSGVAVLALASLKPYKKRKERLKRGHYKIWGHRLSLLLFVIERLRLQS
jgi:hypothetical protein